MEAIWNIIIFNIKIGNGNMKRIILILLLGINFTFAQGELNISKSKMSDLIGANAMSITIGGSFIVNGTFGAAVGERLDQFVTRIFLQAKLEQLSAIRDIDQKQQMETEIEKFSRRDITLKRTSGQILKIDLEKFYLTGDLTQNPYLQNDDVIIFPYYDEDRNFIYVTGAVNNSKKIQFVEGDKLEDAIILAGGLNQGFDNIQKAEISRLDLSGNGEERIEVNISDNPKLQRGDRITIIAEENNRREYKVIVAGEVNRPGNIVITKNSTTLKEVIEKAGGFTDNADLSRAELIRGANVFKSTLFNEEIEAFLMNRMSDIAPEDSTSLIIDNKLRFIRGNGVVNFQNVMDTSSLASKFIVRDYDYIYVPEKLNLVYVFGQVFNPGYVEYKSGEQIDYYLKKAGGKGQNAKDETYLIKGKTRSWIKAEDEIKLNIEPGDYVWVPKEPKRTFSYYLDRTVAISSVITTAATILLLIIQMRKL